VATSKRERSRENPGMDGWHAMRFFSEWGGNGACTTKVAEEPRGTLVTWGVLPRSWNVATFAGVGDRKNRCYTQSVQECAELQMPTALHTCALDPGRGGSANDSNKPEGEHQKWAGGGDASQRSNGLREV